MYPRQLGEHINVGGKSRLGTRDNWKVEFCEQHVAELLR